MTHEIEICYNIRHVERHGRDGKEPWSFRNFAVYQQSPSLGTASWMFVNLPLTIQDHLGRVLSDPESLASPSMLWHAYIVTASLRNWRWYLNDLEDSLKELVCNCRCFDGDRLTLE